VLRGRHLANTIEQFIQSGGDAGGRHRSFFEQLVMIFVINT